MSPVDGHPLQQGPGTGGGAGGGVVAVAGGGGIHQPRQNTVPLAMLVEFIVQKTYHELTVLAELLPRKTDMERKIEVVQFAHQTRQQFIRLLSLVKWANNASKVDKCELITSYLDQQGKLFVDTADSLYRMTHEVLSMARLPNFVIPTAVDVLTTGTYPRLPRCIRDKIIQDDPITPPEKAQTLRRLNQIILYRLVSSKLPQHLSNLTIGNGRVTFRVDDEFEVSLTLMGDDPSIPWRLLSLKILVNDPENSDGKSLVHSLQVQYMHELLQSRLFHNEDSLIDLYNCLHSFCQSLQLAVLHSQTERLIKYRWNEQVNIEMYSVGKCLTLSYWRERGLNEQKRAQLKPGFSEQSLYTMCISVDESNQGKPLQISHTPTLPPQPPVSRTPTLSLQTPLLHPSTPSQTNTRTHVDLFVKSDNLSIEKLLAKTVELRSRTCLQHVKQKLENLLNQTMSIVDEPPVLKLALLDSPSPSEYLMISVNIQTGILIPSLIHSDSCTLLEIEQCINKELASLPHQLNRLRARLCILRCHQYVRLLPVSCSESLPLVKTNNHPLCRLGRYRLYLGLKRCPGFYVVVELIEDLLPSVHYNYYLLRVRRSSFSVEGLDLTATSAADGDGDSNATNTMMSGGGGAGGGGGGVTTGSGGSALSQNAQPFYTPLCLFKLNPYSCSHGPFVKLLDHQEEVKLESKRKRIFGFDSKSAKRLKLDGGAGESQEREQRYNSELIHVVSMCVARIPLVILHDELCKIGIANQGVQVEGKGGGFCVKLLTLPPTPGIPADIVKQLNTNLLQCVFRLHSKGNKALVVQLIFSESPLKPTPVYLPGSLTPGPHTPGHGHNPGQQKVYFSYDAQCVDSQCFNRLLKMFINDWLALVHLYKCVSQFNKYISESPAHLQPSYEVQSYNMKQLVLLYGVNRNSSVCIQWNTPQQRFILSLATVGCSSSSNCHSIVHQQLVNDFNTHYSIAHLLQVLTDTQSPLQAICKLPTMSSLGHSQKLTTPMQNFSIIPWSATHIRIAFRNIHCLDIYCQGKNVVAVRDGAYSVFDSSKIVEGCTPTQHLKAFLNMFVDDTLTSGRQLTADDDNPPSPIGVDSLDSLMGQAPTGPSPIKSQTHSSQSSGYHHNPASNPATPQFIPSPGAMYLGSPPSLQGGVNPSPSSVMIGTPSPATLLTQGSPSTNVGGSQPPQLAVASPGSFVPAPSPGSLGIHMPSPAAPFISPQGALESGGSPYPGLTMPSPQKQTWGGSPAVPGPSPVSRLGAAMSPAAIGLSPLPSQSVTQSPGSAGLQNPPSVGGPLSNSSSTSSTSTNRMLPQGSQRWAASIPTVLSHDALHSMFTPSPPPGIQGGVGIYPCAPMERFLGAVTMRRHLYRLVPKVGENLISVPTNESGVVQFKTDSLQYRVMLSNTLQSLTMKVSSLPETADRWSSEELQIIESFFVNRVACPPYKVNCLTAFCRLLSAPTLLLKDIIQIMRLEIIPDRNMKWMLNWCLTVPPGTPFTMNIALPSAPGVLIKNKLLFFIQLTRIGVTLSPNSEPQTVIVPILYDMQTNITQVAENPKYPNAPQQMTTTSTATSIVSNMLKHFAEFTQLQPGECSVYQSIRDLMTNLVIPH